MASYGRYAELYNHLLALHKDLEMNEGSITYGAQIQGLNLESIEIQGFQPSIDKIVIKTENETRIIITFYIKDIFKQDDAILLTHDYVALLINRISFEFGSQIGEPRCEGWSLPKELNGNRHVVVRDFVVMYDLVGGTINPGTQRLQELKISLLKPISTLDRYLPLYRFAICQSDPISRFLFLYNLILLLNGDKQVLVDNQIISIDNSVPLTPIPHKPNKTETLFTRLRNEVAHTRPNANQELTAKEIINNVSRFQDLVKKALDTI